MAKQVKMFFKCFEQFAVLADAGMQRRITTECVFEFKKVDQSQIF